MALGSNDSAAYNKSHESQVDDLPQAVERLEREMISQALRRSDDVQVKAAKLLGISERNLRYKIGKYSLKRSRKSGATLPDGEA